MRRADARRSASMMINSSIIWSLAGYDVDCRMKTSAPRTFSWISTKTSMSAKRRTIALVSEGPREPPVASASAGLELPATSLMAPLLPAIPSSPARPAETFADLIQAACRTRNMNQDLVPAGFFAVSATALERAGLASAGQGDRIHMAAVIGFGAVGGAAEA